MQKALYKNISFLIGAISMFAAGLLYMIMSDLSFGNQSTWLIVATLFSFGGAIVFFFSNNYLEKPRAMYSMKIVGLVLSVGFIAFLHFFDNSAFFTAKLDDFVNQGASAKGTLAASKATMIISYIFAYVGAVGQAANIVMVATLKEE